MAKMYREVLTQGDPSKDFMTVKASVVVSLVGKAVIVVTVVDSRFASRCLVPEVQRSR